jgi:hypothetical protein
MCTVYGDCCSDVTVSTLSYGKFKVTMTCQIFNELDCCRGSAIKEQSRFETKAKSKKAHAENVKL